MNDAAVRAIWERLEALERKVVRLERFVKAAKNQSHAEAVYREAGIREVIGHTVCPAEGCSRWLPCPDHPRRARHHPGEDLSPGGL